MLLLNSNWFVFLFTWICFAYCIENDTSLLVIIRSQSNEYHQLVATEKKINLEIQSKEHNLNIKVLLLHEEWPFEYGWTLLPLMPDISQKYSKDFSWVLFIEEITQVNLYELVNNLLPKFNSKSEIYLGRCLVDQEITIIHHFAHHNGKVDNFKYPDFHAGWIMSFSLVKKLALDWKVPQKTDFQIDVQHEIATYLDKQYNIKMTCVEKMCGSPTYDNCITFVKYDIPDCGKSITLNDVLISVKTTKMFHETRVNVVKKTWGKYAKNIIYYSNITDSTIPTVDCGVPNTLRGHCGKMQAIIEDAYNKEHLKKYSWLVIADDDSIIGLTQMVKLLNCYESNTPVVLGERYGFALNTKYGYSYITGGGSMVMNRAAINSWVEAHCNCPSIDTPDDMYLGQCFAFTVGVPVTHSARFHQARPADYSLGYINNIQPVSFHKHWEVDPVKVYEKYFADDDIFNFALAETGEALSDGKFSKKIEL